MGRPSSDQARLFLEAAPDATIIVTAAGKLEFANSQTVSLFGYSLDELRNMTLEELVPDRFRVQHMALREGFEANPRVRSMGAELDLFAKAKDGREIPIEVSLSPIPTAEGTLIAAAIRDVTAKKARERALRISEARYRDLFENANDLIQSVLPDGTFQYVNPAWCRALGYEKSEVSGLFASDVIHAASQAYCEEIFSRVTAGKLVERIEATFVTKSGKLIQVEGSASCQLIDGQPGATRAIFHDVTQLKQAKEIAETATAAKSRFLNAASHDLRQPLQALGLYLSVLTRLLEQPKHLEVSAKMGKSLDAMGALLDALLDISRFDGGSVVPQRSDVSVRELLDKIVTSSVQQANDKGLALVLSGEDCVIHTDPALLERVLDNFVTNAIRYTQQGEVRIQWQQQARGLHIAVVDTGIGIATDDLDKVFEEYWQLDNPVRDRHKGLGLGLSIAKHIAQLLGHPIKVASSLGEGSTFSIDVPLGKQALVQDRVP